MEEAFLKLIVTVPAAAAVIVTAWLFLKAQDKLNRQWSDTVKEIAREMISDRADHKKLIEKNTRAMTLVAERLEGVRCIGGAD